MNITRCLPWVQACVNKTENGDSLPSDVIADILSRLPAERIHHLIRPTPYFVDMHLHRATPVIAFHWYSMYPVSAALSRAKPKWKIIMNFTDEKVKKIVSKSIKFELSSPDHSRYAMPRVYSSCNGFLLIKKSLKNSNVLIWNPVTGQEFIVIMKRTTEPIFYSVCGFFFHPKAGEYRVIFIEEEGGFFKFSVLSLATKLLRLIPGDVSHPPDVNRAPTVFNGALHWMVNDQEYRRLFEVWPDCSHSILIFNIDREEFSTMPHPGSQCGSSERRHYCMGLLEIKGCLCFSDNSSSDLLLDIWILEDSIKQVWTKRHVVHIAPIKFSCKVVYGRQHRWWNEAEVEAIQVYGDKLLLRVYHRNLFLYDLRLGTFVRVGRPCLTSGTRVGALAQINSLASLNIDGAMTLSP
ncbi:hypothetical protein IFM89_026265 [Coptis chinensis]|uniref:F-box associated beta-propeller type 3 domain-containing protein n=1 Tax=Coptis chinensis TaxID=261450 RepID=A0A835I1R1_9MAGN|nr:hypothetical protein IFM89_026265 [Coptis chinensis]